MTTVHTTTLLASHSGDEILHHLLTDFLIKGAIVLTGLVVLVIGMIAIWRNVGNPRPHHEPQRANSSRRHRD